MLTAITLITLAIGLQWYLARVTLDYRNRAAHWFHLQLSAEQLVVVFLLLIAAIMSFDVMLFFNLIVDVIFVGIAVMGIHLCVLAITRKQYFNKFGEASVEIAFYCIIAFLILIVFPVGTLIDHLRSSRKTSEERAKENYRLHRDV